MKTDHWILANIRLNWANATAHKGAFWSLAGLMCLQNLIYFMLWVALFSQISSLRGWQLNDVAFLYASGALGYGLMFSLFGGVNAMAHTIQSGSLDIYLARPRSVLLSALLQRMRADSLGDAAVGVVMLILFVQPPLHTLPLLFVLSFSAGLVYVAFRLIMHTLAFWGVGEEGAENGFISFIIASTNPQNGFGPWGKVVLLSVFPAGYVALLPVEIMRNFSWSLLAWQLVASLLIAAFAVVLFHIGLRRYASGNQVLSLR